MNIVLKIGYIGTNYFGFQKQKDTAFTIQGILEQVLQKIFKEDIKVIGAGRTDSGVHSTGQMIQFKPVREIPTDKYIFILNNSLPEDIRIYKAFEVDKGFHVRYDSVEKRYSYRIDRNRVPNLTLIPFALHYPNELDIDKMKAAMRTLVGTHDFSAFASSFCLKEDCVRSISNIELNEDDQGIMTFSITGNGFLHNMVRIIVGTLLDVGKGRYETDVFLKAFDIKDRAVLGKTAKAKGLFLEHIRYREEYLND